MARTLWLRAFRRLKIISAFRRKCSRGRRMGEPSSGDAKPRSSLGQRFSIDRSAIYNLLDELAVENHGYFEKNASSYSGIYGERMTSVYLKLRESVAELKGNISQLQEISPKYDFDEKTPGNGYRSLVCVCDTAVLHLVSLLKAITDQRQSFVFRFSHFCKELEAYVTIIDYLNQTVPLTLGNEQTLNGSLFPPLEGEYDTYQKVLHGIEKLDSTVFFGRPLGFQFSPSVNRIFRVIGVILATYSLSWEKGHGPIGSIISGGRFFLSPEQRASRIIKVTKEADIDFCKGFWNLSELSNNMPKLFCPNMALNELREIDWCGPIPMESTSGVSVQVPEPTAHTGPRPVQIRVLSAVHRQHLSSSPLSALHPPSPYLVLHCHGGGYVATSSKSHETYLRFWAKSLNCPVVSVEYSLAPENPFPRPTEEVLYAYAYIINNPSLLGWTGEKIVMVGDSAGGNLIMSVNLRLIQMNIRRKPDGLVLCYTPFLFQYLPSPSRMLSVMDPLLHMGVVLRCVAAYTGAYSSHLNNNNKVSSDGASVDQTDGQTHRSLQEYVNEVQKTQVDFAGGSQSIVSLVQKSHDDNGYAPAKANSYFKTQDDGFANGCDGKETSRENEKNEEENESDDDLETRSIASVQIDSDPFHIQLSTSLYDGQFIDFLTRHPTTKDQLSFETENEPDVPSPSMPTEPAQEATEELMAQEFGAAIVAEETVTKRPRLLQFISGVANIAPSHTAPSTPQSVQKTLTSSASVHTFTPSALQQKRSLSQSLADTAASTAAFALDNLQEWLERPARQKQKLDRTVSHKEEIDTVLEEEEIPPPKSHILELVNTTSVPRDPLISPMYAGDDLLKELPPCYFLACHLDPLLDDTIAFATKLRNAGGTVESVDLLSSVPHGFLNFSLISPECKRGAKMCIRRLKQALGIPLTSDDRI
ncbi:unnamed protein product [Caenorhabditis auriculariae]|uniref:Hormone-sensitive lipase n=1 Tax=Caenorhabditis auriculariae TaxID=2777116 RepID=A0A8S1HCC0_9PELO|nr:unnamed protein product [Caenorhabditis auriculariae]